LYYTENQKIFIKNIFVNYGDVINVYYFFALDMITTSKKVKIYIVFLILTLVHITMNFI